MSKIELEDFMNQYQEYSVRLLEVFSVVMKAGFEESIGIIPEEKIGNLYSGIVLKMTKL